MKTSTIITVGELDTMISNNTLRRLHTSLTREYVSRKSKGYVKRYNGKFGNGFAHVEPNWESTRYSLITYYVTK